MHAVILPESFLTLLRAFAPCFHAPSAQTFVTVVSGWVQRLGRRTVTAVALAAGVVGTRHSSVFHRFFARAPWALDDLGQGRFRLVLVWLPADAPLVLIVDDTRCRTRGKGISGATMHHDPLCSTRRKPFLSFGHVWVVRALWVPVPMGGSQGFALPLLFRLSQSSRRGGRSDAPGRRTRGVRAGTAIAAHAATPKQTKLELARDLVALFAGWAGARPCHRQPRIVAPGDDQGDRAGQRGGVRLIFSVPVTVSRSLGLYWIGST